FYSLGVQRIVTGGQSMNPSTAQLLEAVESAPADQVVILPNNKNIIPVAEQVPSQTNKVVRIVPTRGIAEGCAALVAYDPEATADENFDAMRLAAEQVVAGEVTRAVRDSACELGAIAEGDYIGISNDGILSIDVTLVDATTKLIEALIAPGHEIVTLIEGDGATAASTRSITEWLGEHHPDLTVEVLHGGQPLYPYLVGVEYPPGAAAMTVTLARLAEIPVTELRGIGPERAEALRDAFGIETVLDLITHYPRRYLDQTRMATISELRAGDQVWVYGRVVSSNVVRNRGKARLELRITDGSGSMRVSFFNQPWRQRYFPEGTEALFLGKVDTYRFNAMATT